MPYIEIAIIKLLESLGGVAQTYEPNAEDGTYVFHDTKF
jgi:hypothetical protein